MKRTFYKITFGVLMTTSTAFAQIPTSGLVAHYPLNGNANNIGGNGYNGTVNGAIPTVDRFGNPNAAYSFTGYNQNISIPNFPVATDNLSISFWVNLKSNATTQRFLTHSWLNSVTPGSFSTHYRIDVDKLGVTSFDKQNNQPQLWYNKSPLTNTWYHMVMVSRTDSVLFFLRNYKLIGNRCFSGVIDFFINS